VDVSPEFISSVTEAVMAEVTAWQSRPLEPMYPVVFFDALRVKIKEDAVVRNKAIYLAWACCPMAAATSWACGSRAPRAPSSG
jgi:putative transposase